MNKLIAVVIALLMAACASSPKTEPAKESKPTSAEAKTASSVGVASNVTSNTEVSASQLSKNDAETAQSTARVQKYESESAYFDFDKSEVKSEFNALLKKEAAILKTNKVTIVLQGNADERGTVAYNKVLGLKRAKAVKRSLVALGASKSQIMVISYGKEKPRLDCHEEKCWHENRRVDFVQAQN